jgi:hypothetical protein
MEIRIDRAWPKPDYTISRLFVNGERFSDGKNYCNSLEDTDRGLTSDMSVDEVLAKKVYGKTAIPRGRYKITVTWSPTFKKMLPLLIAVKGFTGVRIHSGNSPKDTLGCILIGRNDKPGWISDSRYWSNLLQRKIEDALYNGEEVWLQVG